MQKPPICLLLIWHVLGPLKTFLSACVQAGGRACVRTCLCVFQTDGECMRERERERERERGKGQFTCY